MIYKHFMTILKKIRKMVTIQSSQIHFFMEKRVLKSQDFQFKDRKHISLSQTLRQVIGLWYILVHMIHTQKYGTYFYPNLICYHFKLQDMFNLVFDAINRPVFNNSYPSFPLATSYKILCECYLYLHNLSFTNS